MSRLIILLSFVVSFSAFGQSKNLLITDFNFGGAAFDSTRYLVLTADMEYKRNWVEPDFSIRPLTMPRNKVFFSKIHPDIGFSGYPHGKKMLAITRQDQVDVNITAVDYAALPANTTHNVTPQILNMMVIDRLLDTEQFDFINSSMIIRPYPFMDVFGWEERTYQKLKDADSWVVWSQSNDRLNLSNSFKRAVSMCLQIKYNRTNIDAIGAQRDCNIRRNTIKNQHILNVVTYHDEGLFDYSNYPGSDPSIQKGIIAVRESVLVELEAAPSIPGNSAAAAYVTNLLLKGAQQCPQMTNGRLVNNLLATLDQNERYYDAQKHGRGIVDDQEFLSEVAQSCVPTNLAAN